LIVSIRIAVPSAILPVAVVVLRGSVIGIRAAVARAVRIVAVWKIVRLIAVASIGSSTIASKSGAGSVATVRPIAVSVRNRASTQLKHSNASTFHRDARTC
jgi:hypothetical protein